MSRQRVPFFHCVRLTISLWLLALLVAGATSTSANQQQPEDVIAAEIRAQDEQRWDILPEHWVAQEQASLRTFFTNADDRMAGRGYFAIQSARLVSLRELLAKDIAQLLH